MLKIRRICAEARLETPEPDVPLYIREGLLWLAGGVSDPRDSVSKTGVEGSTGLSKAEAKDD